MEHKVDLAYSSLAIPMTCSKCGEQNPEELSQCRKCGEPLVKDSDETGIRPAPVADNSRATGPRPSDHPDDDSEEETGFRPAPSPSSEGSGSDTEAPTGYQPTPSPGAAAASGTPAPAGTPSPDSSSSGTGGELAAYVSFGNRYEILELVGEGGMGRVYKAWDRELEKVIALKTIRGEKSNNPELVKRFKQELLLARKITHKNVIRIHDLGEAEGVRFFTMEYIPGESLKRLVEREGKIPAEQAVSLVKQILGALEEAHSQGVIHRDLKPQNIMIDPEGVLYIMDFGIARSTQDTGGMTATGTMMGTPDYMSPEQVRAEKADARSDLFSFGVILYEMLTGELPYQGDTAASRVMMRLSKSPRPPREIDEDIPTYMENIVLKCLEIDRELRYKNAREILEDIGREQVDRSPVARLQRAVVRRKGAVMAAAVLAVAVGTAVYLAAKGGGPPTAVEEPTTLAIVPFSNASGDESLDWLGPSLAEILITELGQSSHLQTVSSARLYQILNDLRIPLGAKLEPSTITRLAEFSNAGTVVWGQYLKFGEQIRIDATLQDLEEQRTVPLKAEAASESELLGAIETLAQSVQQNLGLSRDIVKELREKSFRPSSDSIQALRLYNEGLQLARQGSHLEALKRFEASTQEDPAFALAYSRLGQTYAELGYSDEAERFSRMAVDLSQQLPPQERYFILANQARILNDHEKAIESYQNLIEALPDDPDVHFSLAGLYVETGAYDQARDHLAKVLERDPNRLDALFSMGRVEIRRGNPEDSLDYLNQSLTLAIRLDNDEARSTVLHLMGSAFLDLRKLEEALRNFEEALATRRRLGDKGGMAVTLKEIATVQQLLGNSHEALSGFKESLRLQKEIGDERGTGRTLIDLGNLYADRGDFVKALQAYKQSLRIQRETGDENRQAMCLNNIGTVYVDGGQYEEALTYLELALRIRENSGNPVKVAETLHNIAETSLKLGRYHKALASYLRALELSRSAGDKEGAAIESFSMGIVFEYQGRYGAALDAKEEALAIFRELQQGGYWLADILRGYGKALSQVGRFEEAQEILEEALELARELENRSFISQALSAVGDLSLYQGDFSAARRLYEDALKEALETTDGGLILQPKISLAKLDLQEGKAENATTKLSALAEESDALGLDYFSTECSIYLAEALVEEAEYARAHEKLEAAFRESEKSNLRPLLARVHYLLGRVYRLRNEEIDARRHYRQAVLILEEMREEAASDTLLERADLNPIYAESTRLTSSPEGE